MEIEILGTESLGVRGLCCFVKTKNRKILIDPGIALGYVRYGLLPHPFQVAVDERIKRKIIKAWSESTDIVISHFHGDHVPLKDANPYQLSLEKLIGLNENLRFWTKKPVNFSPIEKERAQYLSQILNIQFIPSEGRKVGEMSFSKAVPHGPANSHLETVMMTRIEGDVIFVHGSDIQLLNDEAISQIVHWKPDIVLAGGPPLYLNRLSENQVKAGWDNATKLSQQVDTLILDHHLMRNYEGIKWLKHLSSKTEKKVICGADFMKKPRMLLEAKRKQLYKDMPVPEGWHEAYSRGEADLKPYFKKLERGNSLKEIEHV